MTFENVEEAVRRPGVMTRDSDAKQKNILLQDVFNFDLIQVLPEKQFT